MKMEAITLRKRSIITVMCTFFMAVAGLLIYDGAVNESLALTEPDCQACHGTYPATLTVHHNLIGYNYSCLCHAAGKPVRPNADPDHPDRQCLNCHYPGTTKFYRTDAGTDIYASDVTTAHTPLHDKTNVPATECEECHTPAAIGEHEKYPTFNPDPGIVELDCDRCHKNTNSDPALGAVNVQPTITKGTDPGGLVVTCDECHTNIAGAGHATAHDNVLADSVDCTTANCHNANVMSEHTSRGWTCGTCHSGETLTIDPAVVLQVISTSSGPLDPTGQTTAYCTSCHGPDAGNHAADHDQGLFIATPSTQDCTLCHSAINTNQANLVEEHVTIRGFACTACHDRADHVFEAINKGRDPSNLPVYCVDCHLDTTSGQGEGHAPISADAEPWNRCAVCHFIDIYGIDLHNMHEAAMRDMQQDCFVCHVPSGSRPNCIMCHALDQTIWDPLPPHQDTPTNDSLNIIGPGTEDHDKHTSGPLLNNCEYCHVSGVPGSVPLPAPYNECAKCHDGTTGSDIAYGTTIHTVSHIQGAEAAGQGCAYCHSQTPACTDCHQISGPNMVQHDTHTDTLQYNCTECHIAGIAGSEPLPEPYDQCSKCHSPAGQPLQGSDVIYGSLIHTNSHILGGEATPLSCDLCHGAAPPAPSCTTCHNIAGPTTPNHDFHTDTQLIICEECHVSGVPGGTPIPPPYNTCSNCHDGTNNSINISYGQQGHDTHMTQANNQCSRCHTEQPDCSSCHSPGHPDIPAPNNGCDQCHAAIQPGSTTHDTHRAQKNQDCTACHNAAPNCAQCHTAGHEPVPPAFQDCGSCHTTLQPTQAIHEAHKIAAGNNCVTCHNASASCADCHSPGHPEITTFDECATCHTAIQQGSTVHDNHRAAASQDCAVCHNAAPTCNQCHTAGHEPVPPAFQSCGSCHTTLQPTQATHEAHKTAANNNCVTCHSASASCTDCHSPGHPEITTYDECATCHRAIQPGSTVHDNHRSAAQQDCVVCHTAPATPDCSQCHTGTTHTPIPAPNNECDQCHTTLQPGQATHDAHKVATTSGGIVNCAVCHTSSPAPNCGQCHTAGDHTLAHDNAGVPSTGCTNCHDANVVIEHVDNRGFDCATCHDSTDPNVSGAISAGQAGTTVTCYDCHGQNQHHTNANATSGNCAHCHADPRPLTNDPQQLACRGCHIDNNGFVQTSSPAPSHAFNTNGNIQDFGACFDCHAPVPYHAKPTSWPGWHEENQQAPGRNIFNVFRSEMRPSCANDKCEWENRSGYGENSDPERNRDNWNSVNFNWFQIDYQGQSMDVPVFDQGGSVPSHSHNRINTVGNCGDCHTVGTVVPVTHNNNCQACHMSTDPTVQNVIDQGRSGSQVDCFDCHGSQDHVSAHDMTELTDPNCSECHVGNVFTEHVVNRTLTCSNCHSSTDQNVQNAISDGMAGNPVPCQACHSTSAGDHVLAHDNAGVPSNGCTNCHDPNVVTEHVTNRGFVCADCHNNPAYDSVINAGQAGTFVDCYDCHGSTNTHHTATQAQQGDCTYCHADPRVGIDPNAPTGQLACRECHGTNQHDKGGPIQDYGACFACHQPTPYHAKPTSWPGWYEENQSAPGRETFNLFHDELQPNCAGDCENSFERRNGYGENSSPESLNDRNWSSPSISFSMVTIVDQLGTNRQYTVPTFGSGGGGGEDDSVSITRADYSSRRDRLTVYAENTLGKDTQLTVHYDGDTYKMDWDSGDDRWEIRIRTSRCRDDQIEVTSSDGGSDSAYVSGCSN